MLDKLIEPAQRIALWLSSKPSRMRLLGSRIQVIACVVCRDPQPSILLGQSAYHDMWMPPQEGVRLDEQFEGALRRCLEVECGLTLPSSPEDIAKVLYVRSIRYLGQIDLPRERRGERPVADDAAGTLFEPVILRRKAYWMATVLVANTLDIDPVADGRELKDVRWFGMSEARDVILNTNHREKAQLLVKALHLAGRDLRGGPSPTYGHELFADRTEAASRSARHGRR